MFKSPKFITKLINKITTTTKEKEKVPKATEHLFKKETAFNDKSSKNTYNLFLKELA